MARPPHTACDILTKFVDRLPIMPTIAPRGNARGVPLYEVTMRPFQQRLHRDLPATKLWGYNGMFPGPTFDVRRGHPIAVEWKNELPSKHLLTIDASIHGAETDKADVRTVVHLHGAKVMPDSDGYPEAWFTRGFGSTGPFFKNRTYQYPNDQRAATLWYHDHALGITRLNVYAGLSGMYLLRDDVENAFDLPSGQYEVPLIIQDRILHPDGSLVFTGPRVAASEDERHGLKDTVKSMPGEVVRLAMTFHLPGNAVLARGEKLPYVFHCHILEHEENEMMRPYDVVG